MFTSIQITYGARNGQYVLSGLDKNGKTVSTIINDAPLFDALRYDESPMSGKEAIERATSYLQHAAEKRCIRSVGLAKI
jgi:hypothetical protein